MILIIDNYDSFTFNIVQYIGSLGVQSSVVRNDQISTDQIPSNTSHIIISPGPCTPSQAGISVDVVKSFSKKLPILGICLGHQSIGQAFGSEIIKADHLMHGKTAIITHSGCPIFKDIPEKFSATRYHSLIINEKELSPELSITARSANDNYIMAVSHKEYPTFGIQFHPESIATEYGIDILRNFIIL